MKWFKHFTNAHDNNKLTKVRMKYGAEGYAIYWYCLELIAGDLGGSESINFELKHDAEVIGFNLKIDSSRVEEIMRYMTTIRLFNEAEGTVSCLKLAKYLEKKSTRNNTIHKIIDAYQASPTVRDNPRLSPDCPETSELDIDIDIDKDKEPPKSPKGSLNGFGEFWLAYPKKKNKGQAEGAWKKLKPSVDLQATILSKIEQASKSNDWSKDKGQFIPYPSTWLNAKGWEDELDGYTRQQPKVAPMPY